MRVHLLWLLLGCSEPHSWDNVQLVVLESAMGKGLYNFMYSSIWSLATAMHSLQLHLGFLVLVTVYILVELLTLLSCMSTQTHVRVQYQVGVYLSPEWNSVGEFELKRSKCRRMAIWGSLSRANNLKVSLLWLRVTTRHFSKEIHILLWGIGKQRKSNGYM